MLTHRHTDTRRQQRNSRQQFQSVYLYTIWRLWTSTSCLNELYWHCLAWELQTSQNSSEWSTTLSWRSSIRWTPDTTCQVGVLSDRSQWVHGVTAVHQQSPHTLRWSNLPRLIEIELFVYLYISACSESWTLDHCLTNQPAVSHNVLWCHQVGGASSWRSWRYKQVSSPGDVYSPAGDQGANGSSWLQWRYSSSSELFDAMYIKEWQLVKLQIACYPSPCC